MTTLTAAYVALISLLLISALAGFALGKIASYYVKKYDDAQHYSNRTNSTK